MIPREATATDISLCREIEADPYLSISAIAGGFSRGCADSGGGAEQAHLPTSRLPPTRTHACRATEEHSARPTSSRVPQLRSPAEAAAVHTLAHKARTAGDSIDNDWNPRIGGNPLKQDVAAHPARALGIRAQRVSPAHGRKRNCEARHQNQVPHPPELPFIVESEEIRPLVAQNCRAHFAVGSIGDATGKRMRLALQLK